MVQNPSSLKKKNILFIIGSPNQTSQLHQVSTFLQDEYDCWFSQFFPDYDFEIWGLKKGWLEHTIMSGHFKANADKYLATHGLKADYRGEKNHYDMVVYCSDLIVPRKFRNTKSVWVQEGMVVKVTKLSKFVKASKI